MLSYAMKHILTWRTQNLELVPQDKAIVGMDAQRKLMDKGLCVIATAEQRIHFDRAWDAEQVESWLDSLLPLAIDYLSEKHLKHPEKNPNFPRLDSMLEHSYLPEWYLCKKDRLKLVPLEGPSNIYPNGKALWFITTRNGKAPLSEQLLYLSKCSLNLPLEVSFQVFLTDFQLPRIPFREKTMNYGRKLYKKHKKLVSPLYIRKLSLKHAVMRKGKKRVKRVKRVTALIPNRTLMKGAWKSQVLTVEATARTGIETVSLRMRIVRAKAELSTTSTVRSTLFVLAFCLSLPSSTSFHPTNG